MNPVVHTGFIFYEFHAGKNRRKYLTFGFECCNFVCVNNCGL